MSSTRTSKTGEFNQERYCSSPAFEIGLKANVVAKRCSLIFDPAERDFIFWLQKESHKPDGLFSMVKQSPDFKDAVTEKAHDRWMRENDFFLGGKWPSETQQRAEIESRIPEAFRKLTEGIFNFCLDPEYEDASANLPQRTYSSAPKELIDVLRQIKRKKEGEPDIDMHNTTVSAMVQEAIEYSKASGLVLVEGLEQVGKSFAAERWCARHQGTARYVKVPAGSDDFNFFRAIAGALGIASGLSMKAQQMRERIEYTLQTMKLLLCFDDAHNLWPQNNRKEALPNRLNWILNALVDYDVPVVLIAGPQFTQDQSIVARKTLWRAERFNRVLSHYSALPTLTEEELQGIAAKILPEATDNCQRLIASFAKTSSRYCKGVEMVASRARFIANREGRQSVKSGDILKAIQEWELPSERAFTSATEDKSPRGKKRMAATQPRRLFVESDLQDDSAKAEANDFGIRRGTEPESLLQPAFKAV